MKGKSVRGRSKRAIYRSGLERRIVKSLQSRKTDFAYETEKIRYVVPATPKTYTPDFIVHTKSGKKIYVEAKGIWDAADRKKHLLIREQHPDLDIRFVFANVNNKISKVSKITYADICNGLGRGPYKGVTWIWAEKKLPTEWLDE